MLGQNLKAGYFWLRKVVVEVVLANYWVREAKNWLETGEHCNAVGRRASGRWDGEKIQPLALV